MYAVSPLGIEFGVLDVDKGLWIPHNVANKDFRDYLDWCGKGGIPADQRLTTYLNQGVRTGMKTVIVKENGAHRIVSVADDALVTNKVCMAPGGLAPGDERYIQVIERPGAAPHVSVNWDAKLKSLQKVEAKKLPWYRRWFKR